MVVLSVLAMAQATSAAPVTIGRSVPGIRPVAIAAAPSGSRLAVATEDGSVFIIDANTRATLRTLPKHPQPAYAIDWSKDGAWIATGDESGRVWVTDSRTGAKVKEYRTHTRGVQKVSFNATRSHVASTGKDDTIRIYNLGSPAPKEERLILGNGANLYGAAFNPKSTFALATGILIDAGRAYNARTGVISGFYSVKGSQGSFDVAFNPNGTRLAIAGRDGNTTVWEPVSGKQIGTLRGHQDWVVYTAFSQNGRLLATASTDRTIKIWNTLTWQRVADIPDASSVGSPLAFTADGRTLASVDLMGALRFLAVNPPQPVVIAPATPPRRPSTKPPRRRGRG